MIDSIYYSIMVMVLKILRNKVSLVDMHSKVGVYLEKVLMIIMVDKFRKP